MDVDAGGAAAATRARELRAVLDEAHSSGALTTCSSSPCTPAGSATERAAASIIEVSHWLRCARAGEVQRCEAATAEAASLVAQHAGSAEVLDALAWEALHSLSGLALVSPRYAAIGGVTFAQRVT